VLGVGCAVVIALAAVVARRAAVRALRSSRNAQTSVLQTGGGSRADVSHVRIPRLELTQQLRYGEAFRRVGRLQAVIRSLSAGGEELAQLLADGVTSGRLDARAGGPGSE
jgi:hypothetical protein